MSRFFGPHRPEWLTGRQRDENQQQPSRHHGHHGRHRFNDPPVTVYMNAVYYPNYRVYADQPPSILNVSCISHIFYAFAYLKPDGTVYLADPADGETTVDGVQGALRACTELKRQNSQLKVALSIGGGGNSKHFADVAASATKRAAFVTSCKHLVDTYGLDGIDIDWEHPSDSTQGANFTRLVAALRAQLPAPLYVLTAALPAAQWCLQHIPDLSATANQLTTLNLMAYDFAGPWTPTSGHHSPLYAPRGSQSGNAGVQYCISQGVPASKLLLGIPAYGRSFLGCDAPGQPHSGRGGGEDGVFEYRLLPRPGATEVVDHGAVAAYCVGGDGGFVSYDNVVTVEKKARFVRQEGLAGLFYWTGTGDKPREEGLVYAGYMALHGA